MDKASMEPLKLRTNPYLNISDYFPRYGLWMSKCFADVVDWTKRNSYQVFAYQLWCINVTI